MKFFYFILLFFLLQPFAAFAKQPKFFSESILVSSNDISLFKKASNKKLPIASITKLVTAMIILDGEQDMNELITITIDDVDQIKKSNSRILVGSKIHRYHLIYLMLMSSDNRAAHALARTYYCGIQCFPKIMNSYAFLANMNGSKFVEPTGLSSQNISTSEDLIKLMTVAKRYDMISIMTSTPSSLFYTKQDGERFNNTNMFVKIWDIGVSKTGYIKESGYCIVMTITYKGNEYLISMLNAKSKKKRSQDLIKIKKIIETGGFK